MNPCTVFIPWNKGREKTLARGFWRDNGKVYYDYIQPCALEIAKYSADITPEIERLRVKYNQLAMFYISRDAEGDTACAYTQSANGAIEALPHKKNIAIRRNHKNTWRTLRGYIAHFIQIYGGCTVYINHDYIIEAWHK